MFAVILSIFAEVLAIVYTYLIRGIILFIRNKDAPYSEGIIQVSLFTVSALLSTILKNLYSFHTYKLTIKLRKTLICALYEKVGKLSLKSLIKTNQGRIV